MTHMILLHINAKLHSPRVALRHREEAEAAVSALQPAAAPAHTSTAPGAAADEVAALRQQSGGGEAAGRSQQQLLHESAPQHY